MTNIESELTAVVWKVLAAVGDQVVEGEEIAILESMKMEIPVEAPASGVIAEICVEPGASVAPGTVIAVLA